MVMLETPTTNEIKLHLWRRKYGEELGGGKEKGNNVVAKSLAQSKRAAN